MSSIVCGYESEIRPGLPLNTSSNERCCRAGRLRNKSSFTIFVFSFLCLCRLFLTMHSDRRPSHRCSQFFLSYPFEWHNTLMKLSTFAMKVILPKRVLVFTLRVRVVIEKTRHTLAASDFRTDRRNEIVTFLYRLQQ